jgi:threonine/homoserine/homoserine lactone efflux protein
MLGTTNLEVFIAAGLLLNITPGADILFIAGKSAAQGSKAGIIAALGIGTGCLFHILFAAFGLSVMLATSALLFTVVKLAGAAYLVYLGVSTLFSLRKMPAAEVVAAERPLSYSKIFWQGVLVNALNPKVALFFMAFLPQFVSPEAISPATSFIFLGCLFNCNGTLVNILFAAGSAKIAGSFKHRRPLGRLLKTGVGGLFIWLGMRLALTTQR